jgi:hypothetical protein
MNLAEYHGIAYDDGIIRASLVSNAEIRMHTTENQTYQGWTNWETWNTNLWISNDPVYYRMARRCDSVNALRALWRCMSDSVSDKIDTDMINFEEIFQSVQEE